MSPLRWTSKSTGQLALALTRGGHPVSADTVGNMLRESGYSLQANVKTTEGTQHPDRDLQFRYLNEKARDFRDVGLPVVSVDAKKKELSGVPSALMHFDGHLQVRDGDVGGFRSLTIPGSWQPR